MKNAKVRKANPQDARDIARIQLASWRATYSGIVPDSYLDAMSHDEYEAFWRECLTEATGERVYYVAEDPSGATVGFSSGGPGREPPADDFDGELYTVYVAPGSAGSGAGTQLVRAAATGLVAAGFRSIYCWVMAGNHGARAFYERLGGRKCGEDVFVVDGVEITEVAYGWRDATVLAGGG